jgi:transcriptional regulator with XRE-family HTH domain
MTSDTFLNENDDAGPNPVDIYVGAKLRTRRSLIGMSQEKLAEAAGIKFQQIQKYETGKNRISASRLYEFAKTLGVSVSYFFEGYNKNDAAYGFSESEQEGFEPEDVMARRETIDLVRTYYSIQDDKARKDVLKMLKQMAKTFDSGA